MKKNLLFLSLGLGLFLTGCQTEPVSEEYNQENISAVKTGEKGAINRIHEPVFIEGIHEPVFLKNGFEDCDLFPEYDGLTSLNVMKGQSFDFSKKVELENLRVAGDLNICGEIQIEKNAVIRKNGVMTTVGLMVVGTEDSPKDLVINYGGHLNINGVLIVTGDLILNTGATLDYINDDLEHNYLWVMGEIRQAEYSFLRGTYNVYTEDEHSH
ncbi:hypothetical protein [Christiangramia aquimixticola]|uniref:hypothetical protein n=1 Tax=Christiangramia aquimixticola TaxID=1697558 RepID=UPI003AA9411B